ncbi:hypothetical protein [Campylobacter sp. MIT 97-5078]|nr:hypothetical protein [Campylobacter sp. MIT 97-5078]KGI57256.1 hypothetical protein LR59_00485 [Campylobacter sp. MIT 97-5078]TQR27280.1 hypothetical protein DMB91_04590 [Campylobacter sp. MIT 97-5078]
MGGKTKQNIAIVATGTVYIGMASLIENSLVQKHLQNFNASILKISHPRGIIECEVGIVLLKLQEQQEEF